jgi:hypothetical protein
MTATIWLAAARRPSTPAAARHPGKPGELGLTAAGKQRLPVQPVRIRPGTTVVAVTGPGPSPAGGPGETRPPRTIAAPNIQFGAAINDGMHTTASRHNGGSRAGGDQEVDVRRVSEGRQCILLTDPAVLIADFLAAAGALSMAGWPCTLHGELLSALHRQAALRPVSVPSTPSPSAPARPPQPGPEWSSRSARWDRTAMRGSGRSTTRHPGGLPWPRAFWHTRSSGHDLASPSSMRRA